MLILETNKRQTSESKYHPPVKKPREFCANFEEFIKVRNKALDRLSYYCASFDAGIRDAYCGFVCPYSNRNFVPLSVLEDTNEESIDPEKIEETFALLNEIELDKYYRSQEVGYDIGWENAVRDFREHHLSPIEKGFKACMDVVSEK